MDLLTIKRTETDKTDNNTMFSLRRSIGDTKSTKQYVKIWAYCKWETPLSERQRKQRMFWKRFLEINLNIFLAISAVAALKRNLSSPQRQGFVRERIFRSWHRRRWKSRACSVGKLKIDPY